MERELMLLRHGKSSWSNPLIKDFTRPLKKRGRRDARNMGRFMDGLGWIPDYVAASPAERTRQTANLLCKELTGFKRSIRWRPEMYDSGIANLIRLIEACPGHAGRVLLIGHNPGLVDLVRFLCAAPIPLPPDRKLIPTATLVRIAMPDDWRRLHSGCGELRTVTRPKSLLSR